MEESPFRRILDDLASTRYGDHISHNFYGEPLLDKRLPRFAEYIRERVPRAYREINSDGDILTLGVFRDHLRLGLGGFLINQPTSSARRRTDSRRSG